jgi:hypothetical protein
VIDRVAVALFMRVQRLAGRVFNDEMRVALRRGHNRAASLRRGGGAHDYFSGGDGRVGRSAAQIYREPRQRCLNSTHESRPAREALVADAREART